MRRSGKKRLRRQLHSGGCESLGVPRRRLLANEILEKRLMLSGDGRFLGNASLATAANVGVGPGVHIIGLSLSAGANDWYRFQVLRTDSVDVNLGFVAANGQLGVEVRNAAGSIDVTGTANPAGATATLANLAPGTYYTRVYGATPSTTNTFSISVDPSATSTTRMIYVNDASTTNDFYSLAAGNDANTGLSLLVPMASVQAVVANYALGPTDLVVVDTGTYANGSAQISSADQGAAYAGSPGGSTFQAGFELTDASYNLLYGMNFSGFGGTGIYATGNGVNFSTHNTISSNTFTGLNAAVQINGGDSDLILNNVITGGGSYGVLLSGCANDAINNPVLFTIPFALPDGFSAGDRVMSQRRGGAPPPYPRSFVLFSRSASR